MRIVHTCLRYPPATGGVERYVQELVTRTRDKQAQRDVRVVTSRMRTHGPVSLLAGKSLRDDPPFVQRLHHMATPCISYPRLQALSYYLQHHRPDVIHGYSFWYHPADGAAAYARKHDLPFIFHPIYYENEVRQKWYWQLYKRTRGRKTFASAEAVIVISPYEQALIEQTKLPVKRFITIPPGIDFQKFQGARANPFVDVSEKGPVILSVSRLSPGKGLESLIKSLPATIRRVPDVQLVFVGEDFGSQAQLEKLAKDTSVHDHVHFTGRLNDEELIGAYQHAAVLAHPSYYEAFGIVLAESMAAGTPVVARNTAAIPFVAPHETGGLLFNSQSELSEQLIELLTNNELRAKLGDSAQRHAQNTFGWDKSINRLLELYRELV